MAIFKGAGVAIVTPMYDNEEVNYDKLEELINMQIDNGTDAIIIAGTTGESPCLSMEEHAKVIKAAVEFTKHRVPVVAGTGSNCTKTAMQLSKEAEEFGADGLLVVTPYYNKATQAGLVSHYSQSVLLSYTTYRDVQAATCFRRLWQSSLRQRKISWDSRKLQEIWHRLQRQCI